MGKAKVVDVVAAAEAKVVDRAIAANTWQAKSATVLDGGTATCGLPAMGYQHVAKVAPEAALPEAAIRSSGKNLVWVEVDADAAATLAEAAMAARAGQNAAMRRSLGYVAEVLHGVAAKAMGKAPSTWAPAIVRIAAARGAKLAD